MLIVYDSLTGNVQRFINSLEIRCIKIHDGLLTKEPFILVTYSTGFGQIPKSTAEFLKLNSNYLKGVAVSGNKNWGEFYGKSGETISNYYNVPLLMKFEMSGTKKERDNFIMEVKQFDNINS